MTQDISESRQRTAIRRHGLSRPVRLALEDGVVSTGATFFDYGCGHGEDVLFLRNQGIQASGWDPAYSPQADRVESDVVNLGYVVNVIEDPRERAMALQEAWTHARSVLVVAARLTTEDRPGAYNAFADGVVTGRGTFQKFYEQHELRDWIDGILDSKSAPAAPGVFYVFRDAGQRESFVSSRYRRRIAAPSVRKSDVLFEEHRAILEPLVEFLNERGRLPELVELPDARLLERRLGSVKRALGVVARVTGDEDWRRVREERSTELAMYLALARFGGRPRFSELPDELRWDIRAFFGNYKKACKTADDLLFSSGDPAVVAKACSESRVGKLVGSLSFPTTMIPL